MNFRCFSVVSLFVLACAPALAQQPENGSHSAGQHSEPMGCMPGMAMPGCPEAPHAAGPDLMTMQPATFLQKIASHAGSGTSVEPISTPASMLMAMHGPWMLMFHANAFLLDQQQSGPRGGDKLFSANWLMPMAQRRLGAGVFTLRAMLSLEPATISGRQYPLLFQQGETAFGRPIADAQHPHDFWMELAALYDWKIAPDALLSVYLAPVGDPALGPAAFPHRASAAENPLASLGHHQQDSTHIAADVATLGITYKIARFEASGFHGREPDENRWNIDQRSMDSWSTRLTLAAGKNWAGQFSYGWIHSPEASSPGEDQSRITASVTYNRPFPAGNWNSTALWGRTRSRPDARVFDSYLVESTLNFRKRNAVWTRIESAERSSELLFRASPLPAGFQESPIGRVLAATLGYDREISPLPKLSAAIGAQGTIYGVPDILRPLYGTRPLGVAVFLRLRPEMNE